MKLEGLFARPKATRPQVRPAGRGPVTAPRTQPPRKPIDALPGFKTSRLTLDPDPGAPSKPIQGPAPEVPGKQTPKPGPANPTMPLFFLRAEAEKIWAMPRAIGTAPAVLDGFRSAERKFRPVNAPGDGEAAQRLMNAARDQVMASLASLSPADRTKYRALGETLGKDDAAKLALVVLLVDGALTGPSRSSTGKNLLDTLTDLGAQRVAEPLDRQALLASVIQEIAMPSTINQSFKNTCTVTSIQILAAKRDPAEYARIVGGLASPEGRVVIRNGSTVTRSAGTEKPDDTMRSDSARLWQAAMMDHANGDRVTYDNASDRHIYANGYVSLAQGLAPDEVDRLLDGLAGKDTRGINLQPFFAPPTPAEVDRVVDEIKASLDRGLEVPVGLQWGSSSTTVHVVLVSNLKGDRVYFNNPWGSEESMSLADFKSRLTSAHII